MAFPSRKEIDRLNYEIKVEPESLSIIVAVKKVELKKGNTSIKFAYGMGTAILGGDRSDTYKEGQILRLTWNNADESGNPVVEIVKEAD